MLNVYVSDLTAKNHGDCVGKWIALPMKKDELRSEINKILAEGEKLSLWDDLHEEWEIDDWEWDDEIPSIYEPDIRYSSVFSINKDISAIKEKVALDEYKVLKFLLDDGYDLDEAINKVKNVDIYEDSTLEEVARQKFDDYFGLETDAIIRRYMDFEQWGDDLRQDDYHQVGNDVLFLGN